MCDVRYGWLTTNGVKAAFSPFFVLSTKILRSTSSLWAATQLWLQVMPLAIKWLILLSKPLDRQYDRPGQKFEAVIVEPAEV